MRCFRFKSKDKASAEPNARIASPQSMQRRSTSSSSLSPNHAANVTALAAPAMVRGRSITPGSVVLADASLNHTPGLAQIAASPRSLVDQGLTRTPWEQAVDKLKTGDRESLNSSLVNQDPSQPRLNILRGFIEQVEKKRKEVEGRQWRYTNSSGEVVLVRDRMDVLLVNLNKFTAIGDLVIQPLPSVASLVWGGFKILLQVATTLLENTAVAMESLDSLVRIMGHCSIYERLYSQHELVASRSLNDALVELYVSILVYLCYLARHLGHNTAVQGFKNIASGLKSRWDALLVIETHVDKEARIAHQEATEKLLYNQSKEIDEMVAILKDTNALREPIIQIKRTVENIFQSIQDDEREKILNWLSDVSHKKHHDFHRAVRSDGTGAWLLEKESVRSWKSSNSSSLLWLHGIAGSGKTTLASKIIDDIASNTAGPGDALAYFYCNYKEDKRRDPAAILRSIIKQLCLMSPGGDASFPEPVLAIYTQRKTDGDLLNHLSIEESKDLLVQLSTGFLCTTIVIDALDECDADSRGSLFDVLDDVVSSSSGGNPIKVFVTSRDDGDLRRQFENRPNVYIQERDNSGDINHYIKTEIETCINRKHLLGGNVSRDLQGRIVTALETGARGMFIWVTYQIKRLCGEVTEEGVEKALTEVPKDLDQIYLEMLHSIRVRHESSRRVTMAENALKWILYAVRPLSPAELIEAISLTPESTTSKSKSDNLTLSAVFDICENLVVLDERLGVLRFAHFTVQEFLLRHFRPKEGHTGVAEVCLTLVMNNLTSTVSFEGSEEPAMFDYAMFNWPEHVRLAGPGSTTVTGLCKSLLQPSEAYESWVSWISTTHKSLCNPIAPILVASYFQLVHIFGDLLDKENNPNSLNHHGSTSLHFAAINGNEDIVRLLFERRGVELDIIEHFQQQTPLSLAAENGHEKVLQMLLGKGGLGVNVGHRNRIGETPLLLAAKNGHEQAVQVLLKHTRVDVNSKDTIPGWTPLSWAARSGHDKVVQALLQNRRVDVDHKGRNKKTPLSLAACYGHDTVVRVLARNKGVDVNSEDLWGRTPLCIAAWCGREKVVQVLLEHEGVNVNSRDRCGRTPLFMAARDGRENVVKILIENENVDMHHKDKFGRTPHSWAAENGHQKVVEMLHQKARLDQGKRSNLIG